VILPGIIRQRNIPILSKPKDRNLDQPALSPVPLNPKLMRRIISEQKHNILIGLNLRKLLIMLDFLSDPLVELVLLVFFKLLFVLQLVLLAGIVEVWVGLGVGRGGGLLSGV
jgi:hypothetical protein